MFVVGKRSGLGRWGVDKVIEERSRGGLRLGKFDCTHKYMYARTELSTLALQCQNAGMTEWKSQFHEAQEVEVPPVNRKKESKTRRPSERSSSGAMRAPQSVTVQYKHFCVWTGTLNDVLERETLVKLLCMKCCRKGWIYDVVVWDFWEA
jgi:hypothetical protein